MSAQSCSMRSEYIRPVLDHHRTIVSRQERQQCLSVQSCRDCIVCSLWAIRDGSFCPPWALGDYPTPRISTPMFQTIIFCIGGDSIPEMCVHIEISIGLESRLSNFSGVSISILGVLEVHNPISETFKMPMSLAFP